ncbi:TolC family protein [Danxiaibacter flavus]|uniref:TolC family protein n=1 Tax=Danxiaibacter flavus TaxID=3049108 RepID=A0ABV3ZH09_9BACT|nr:TolC family protein [Chitinophagaceae bacterium DXS]
MSTIRRYVMMLTCCLPGMFARAQSNSITIEECYTLARNNFPQIKKLDLISKSSNYSLENASKLYLPQVSVNGQASYQSPTVTFPDILPGVPGHVLPQLSKDQYKVTADVSQLIYDGGNISNQKELIRANTASQQQSVEVALYSIKERVNQIFFAILLMDQQLRQNEIRKSNLQNSADKAAAAFEYGTAFRSNVDELKAEVISADMTSIDFVSTRTAYVKMLGILIGKELDDSTKLVMPELKTTGPEINRPELKLYDLQRNALDVEERRLKTDHTPKFSAFAQGGYGRPTLNFVDNSFGTWYMVGAKFTWNIGSFYTLKNNKLNLDINRQTIEAERETFLYNTKISLQQQDGEVIKYQQLLKKDIGAVELRTSVRKSAEAQLANGVITTHDYIAQVNAEDQSRQLLILHQVQLLQAQYKINYTSGN